MGSMVFVIDAVEIERLLLDPAGPVARHVVDVATVVQLRAQAVVPVDTGRLRASIVKRIIGPTGDTDYSVQVGVWTVPYAMDVHEGTDPHDIPNAFGWGPRFGIGGRFDGKFHPGTKARRFLTDSLEFVGSTL